MNRTRSNDGRFTRWGSYYSYGNLQDFSGVTQGPYELCYDTTDERDTSNVFDLVRTFTAFPYINCPGEFVDYTLQYHPGPDDPRGAWPAYNMADKNALAWEILAKTNPSVPEVNVPAYLGELKDIPGTMKGWGRSLLRDAARGYISWRWAVKPLVNDLAKLYNFQKSVNNRMMELYALRDGRTLKRRCNLVRASSTYVNHVLVHGIRFTWWAYRAVDMRTHSWGTAEWKLMPDSKLPELGYAPLEGLARTSAAGINSYGALEAAWELTPWSWLADWFSNVGTCIHASNNALGLTFGRISLMRTSTSVSGYSLEGVPPSQFVISGKYVEEMTRKERYPVFPVIPVPLPTLPLLTGKQLSILGALAVLKGIKP
jgi:hypothetical protein